MLRSSSAGTYSYQLQIIISLLSIVQSLHRFGVQIPQVKVTPNAIRNTKEHLDKAGNVSFIDQRKWVYELSS